MSSSFLSNLAVSGKISQIEVITEQNRLKQHQINGTAAADSQFVVRAAHFVDDYGGTLLDSLFPKP